MGRKRGGDAKKHQIVQGLLQAMASQGYERSSIASIAKEAGLASGLVHYYFKSKQEILLALMGVLGAHLQARYTRRLQSASSDPWTRLDACIEAYVGLAPPEATQAPAPTAPKSTEGEASILIDDDPAVVRCWVTIGAEALHLPQVCEVYESIVRDNLERLKLHLVEVLATEGRETAQVHVMAGGLMAAIEGAYRLGTASERLVPRGFASTSIKQMVRGLVTAQPLRDGTTSEAS